MKKSVHHHETPGKRRRRNDDEHRAQVAVFTWAKMAACNDPRLNLLFAIPNGGARNVVVAKKLKAEGVKAGVPDLFLPVQGEREGFRIQDSGVGAGALKPKQPDPESQILNPESFSFSGLFIEMKTASGRVQPNQNRWHEDLRAQGYQVEVCRSSEEAIRTIINYLGSSKKRVWPTGRKRPRPGG